ncbi:L10-interacting MYB domain-containing protein [Malania oleifera]|uniref:L10-interacting MYB domain-containing protein n=1 Tax=Malania oleifera TaxID=397392 RepID=UPI0025AE3DAC|nr:L10-interacting MYB domain-containing protein [Malania oleifera]
MASEQRTYGASTPKVKANWTPAFHKIFVDLCLEQTLKGNKPGTHFTKEGWRNIADTFCKRSGLRYDKKQLKNHWDVTKEQWKVWCKLVGTSSMKWDPNTQTFGASEEDWTNYLQTNPDAAQFRYKELQLADQLETIFDGTVTIGETEPPTQRRKQNDGSASSLLPIRVAENAIPYRKFQQHCDAVESRSTVTVQSVQGERNYSIGECIECLDEIEEVEPGSELYLFALDVFLKKDYREIFLQLKTPGIRVAWLQWRKSAGPPLH